MKNQTSNSRFLESSSSAYLDTLRICAALSVLIYHVYFHWLPADKITIAFDRISHTAVIVFFVLSGYVIAYSTSKKNNSANDYFIARFSKLYSVVLPALILTGIAEYFIKVFSPELMLNYGRNQSVSHYIISTLFCNEIWFYSAAPQLNMPLWSLSFEFWYYVIFGFFHYRKFQKKYPLLAIAACLVAGPKILLMMPIWLFGYFAYKIPYRSIPNRFVNWYVIMISISFTFVLVYFVKPLSDLGTYPLVYASQFLTDWMIGAAIAIGLYFLPTTDARAKMSNTALIIRKIADLTFPLYVLHLPLIVLWDTFLKLDTDISQNIWKPIIGVLILSGLIGVLLEKCKYLYIGFFSRLLKSINMDQREKQVSNL